MAAGSPAATVFCLSRTNAFLTAVPSFAGSISYHPNTMVNQVAHANGVTDAYASVAGIPFNRLRGTPPGEEGPEGSRVPQNPSLWADEETCQLYCRVARDERPCVCDEPAIVEMGYLVPMIGNAFLQQIMAAARWTRAR